MPRHRTHRSTSIPTLRGLARLTSIGVLPLAGLACGSDDEASTTTASAGSTTSTGSTSNTTDASADVGATSAPDDQTLAVVAGEAFPARRCAANEAAGTITYLSSFDFAASASIVEVLVAEKKGYFDELCLDVEVKPSFSTDNYPQLAANNAQFSSGGSFSEIVDYSTKNDAQFVAVAVEGKAGIDALIVKEGEATALTDLRGATIGVKGAMTQGVAAMLQKAGLVEGTDYTTVLLDGFDPKLHIEVPAIAGFPGYKSNEPLQLQAAGVPFTLFDPADYGIPGSFGILYSNAEFLAEHPTAAEDFVRAAMRGLADAVDDPTSASGIALEFINGNGNALFLSPEGEQARWAVESRLVIETNTSTALGVPELARLQAELDTHAAIGRFGGSAPDAAPYADVDLVAGVYDDEREVIWPAAR
jgi:NitT/TauT family transport system substrate-binding protein